RAASDADDASLGRVYRAEQALRAAITELFAPSEVTTVRVSKGATIGFYEKQGIHYTVFKSFRMFLNAAASDDAYDVYEVKLPLNTSIHSEAYIHGQTLKDARFHNLSAHGTTIDIDLIPLSGFTPGVNAREADVYTNADDTGSFNLAAGGDPMRLDVMRVWQAMEGVVFNYFVEPDFTYELMGDSITIEQTGTPGRDQVIVTPVKPGVSVLKITYDPINFDEGGNHAVFNGIARHNVGTVVFNVDGGGSVTTGIDVRNDFDTYYFDKGRQSGYSYSFKPEAGAGVRVHDPVADKAWGAGWTDYSPAADGSFTVTLKEGRNIIEVRKGDAVRYHVVKARGLGIRIDNETHPGKDPAVGDTVTVSFDGLETPVHKLSGIYNPGFGGTGFVSYWDRSGTEVRGKGVQYNISQVNAIKYTITDGDHNVLTGGQIHINHLGSPLGAHRSIPDLGLGANLDASTGSNAPYFGALPDLVLVPADKTALQASIGAAEVINGKGYSAASWKALQNALASAKLVDGDMLVGQSAVDDARAALQSAIDALKVENPPIIEMPTGGGVEMPDTGASGDAGAPAKVTVKLNVNGGKGLSLVSQTYSPGDKLGPLPSPARKGYRFAGWYSAKSGGTKLTAESVVPASGDFGIYAHWTAKKYTVKLNVNGGNALAAKQRSKTVAFDAKVGKLPTPTKPGHVFKGWYTAKEGGKRIGAATIYELVSGKTLYAHWAKVGTKAADKKIAGAVKKIS
ncbi:MAG: InlB B-repeat-containing protein, partial [Clostridiales Family XIII bacterium]|nr:InlB B-repeat-containing protein [Clostridiales Family XIII bacterium]